VKECNRLGILEDLAHASPETVLAALKVATQPVLCPTRASTAEQAGIPGWRR
jgi:microsomal dipeptidase-like Zn-dependent dipeptidase